jgi:hypothetical protein
MEYSKPFLTLVGSAQGVVLDVPSVAFRNESDTQDLIASLEAEW